MDFAQDLVGIWTCEGGEAAGAVGLASWSGAVLGPMSNLIAVAAGGPGTVHLSLRDPTLRFEAVGNFAWATTLDIALCAVRAVTSESLVGQMTFVST